MADWPYNTAQWQSLRRAKLAESPLCEPCYARRKITVAVVVDHIAAITKGGDPFPALSGLSSMCARCHNIKTRAFDTRTGKRIIKGCDVNGYPLDPSHHWNQGRGEGEDAGLSSMDRRPPRADTKFRGE